MIVAWLRVVKGAYSLERRLERSLSDIMNLGSFWSELLLVEKLEGEARATLGRWRLVFLDGRSAESRATCVEAAATTGRAA